MRPHVPALDLDCDPHEIAQARECLGERLGLGRPLSCLELANALELTGPPERRREYVSQMEHGSRDISGPIRVALRAMLDGYGLAAINRDISLAQARSI